MKFKINISTIIVSCLMIACSASDYDYPNNDVVEVESITEVVLKPNHYQLVSNGIAEIDLNPVLFKTDDKVEVLNDRVNQDWITYYTASGEEIERFFSTTDQSLNGSTIEVYAMVNGMKSNTVSFKVESPLDLTAYEEITYPVVVHLIQTKSEVLNYGGEIPAGKIDKLLERMNNVFSGSVSNNPVGVDTKVRFKPALYTPNGDRLFEDGINRFIVDGDIVSDNKYKDFIEANSEVNWPQDKYLNVWIFTDSQGAYKNFSWSVTEECEPYVVFTGTNLDNEPQGLDLTEVEASSWNPDPKDYGLKIKASLLDSHKLSFTKEGDNDFMHYMGNYFGLLKTYHSSGVDYIPDDYCEDTFGYAPGNDFYKENKTTVKETSDGYRFVSENVMDDQTGLHKSISEEQMLRIRWVAENCPARFAWKSDFAFTGEE